MTGMVPARSRRGDGSDCRWSSSLRAAAVGLRRPPGDARATCRRLEPETPWLSSSGASLTPLSALRPPGSPGASSSSW